MTLLVELFENDVADFILDLLARHCVERAQIDETKQPLVKFDLKVGVEFLGAKKASVARGLEPALSLGPVGDFLRGHLVLGFANLPHCQRSSPRAPATLISIASISRET